MNTLDPCRYCDTVCYADPCDARSAATRNVFAYIDRAQAGFDARHGATGQSTASFADLRARLGQPNR